MSALRQNEGRPPQYLGGRPPTTCGGRIRQYFWRRQALRWLILPLVATWAGCGTLPIPSRGDFPHPLSAEQAAYYSYPRQSFSATVKSSHFKSGYQLLRLQLSPPETSSSKPIVVDWYKPSRPGRRPVILFSPILAGNDLYVREFAQFYAARGLHAVIVYRPKEIFSTERDLTDIETHFRESVIGLRQTIDWLERQESVDSHRIGSYGISLGAFLTTILAAVEPRIRAHIFGLPAGHVAEIIMTSQDKTIRKRRKAYLEKQGWDKGRGLEELTRAITSDPIRFAPAVDPHRALVIAGLFDRVLGFHRSLELWKAMGRPRLILLPTGHYSTYFATPYLKIVTYSFFCRLLS